MSKQDVNSISMLCQKLETHGVRTELLDPSPLPPAHVLEIDAAGWGRAAEIAHAEKWRWAGVWAEDLLSEICVYACLEQHGVYLILCSTDSRVSAPAVPSAVFLGGG